MKRILAVDPGDRRIGMAMSDPTGTLARPLDVIAHQSRRVDAAVIANIASQNDVGEILIGIALTSDGEIGPQARKALRFAEAVKEQTDIPVRMWDESHSTQTAQQRQRELRLSLQKRKSSIDSMAAVVILQGYLEWIEREKSPGKPDKEENV